MRRSRKKPITNGGVFEDAHVLQKIHDMEATTNDPHFWDDQNEANKTFAKIADLKDSYYPWKNLVDKIDETAELIDLYASEPDDPAVEGEVDKTILELNEEFEKLH